MTSPSRAAAGQPRRRRARIARPRSGLAVRAASAAAIAALLAAGCSSGDKRGDAAQNANAASPSGSTAPGTPSPAPPPPPPPPPPKGQDDPALKDFYTQKLAWEACKDDPETTKKDEREFQCAMLRVPLDYANPAARGIEIALLRHPAADSANRVGSLLVNPGGPGGSGYDMVKYGFANFDGALHDRFDVVGFDPRGTNRSSPVTCLTDAERDARSTETGPDPADEAAEKAYSDRRQKEFADACQAKSGDLLPHIGTRNVARDMDVLRAAVGDAKLHYLGISYGTFLGSLYIEEFPDRVGRLVLDAAVDPAEDMLEKGVEQQIGFEKSFTRFAKDCAARPGCPLGRDPEKAARVANDFLDGLRLKPLRTNDPKRRLTSSLAWDGAISLLYGTEDKHWKWLREALTYAMRDRNGTALLFYADQFNGRDDKGHYDGSEDSRPAIRCVDQDSPAASPERIQEVLARFKREAPIFSEYATASDFEGPGCEFWPVRTTEKPHVVKAPPGTPVLVVGTTGDPATPYAASERLAAGLGNARLLTLEGEGHAAFGQKNACIDGALSAYLLEGTVPAEGTRCT